MVEQLSSISMFQENESCIRRSIPLDLSTLRNAVWKVSGWNRTGELVEESIVGTATFRREWTT